MSSREQMKRQLCAAIDDLSEDKGFVLVVTDDEISFTPLRSGGGWDGDSYLYVEELTQAEKQRQRVELGNAVRQLELSKKSLEAGIAAAETRLADLNAAIANALGGRG
ncbi:hypothetical protein ACFYY5_29025 [Nocardia elegans]|uniref:Uncharacterized protein n=1 Tax=Nocardia elegans TaxID=300029 RepID=A0ABW6TL95_9NOCA